MPAEAKILPGEKYKQNFNIYMLHRFVNNVEEPEMFKVLVVEDDRELNRTVCAWLGQNGYEPVGCLSANEAYDAMYGNMFDIIV